MQLERRYIVFKLSDLKKYAGQAFIDDLDRFGKFIDHNREAEGKPPLKTLVIEEDWPEFEITWEAIKSRMRGYDDLFLVSITTAYEQGVGKGMYELEPVENPYEEGSMLGTAWEIGYAEGIGKRL